MDNAWDADGLVVEPKGKPAATRHKQASTDDLKILPWDSDIDVQVSESTIHFLANYYNMTIHKYVTPKVPEGRKYMMEINPNYINGSITDRLNVIDGRWIDTITGVFIDITTVRPKKGEPGLLGCKDRHNYEVRNPQFPRTGCKTKLLTSRQSRPTMSSPCEIAYSKIDQ